MKRLQEETMCKMAVLGRGSMKDKQKVGNKGRLIFFLLFIFEKEIDLYFYDGSFNLRKKNFVLP